MRRPAVAVVIASSLALSLMIGWSRPRSSRGGRPGLSFKSFADSGDAASDGGVDGGEDSGFDSGSYWSDSGADSGTPYDSGIDNADDWFSAAGSYQWPASPSGCSSAPWSMTSRDGGPAIPNQDANNVWSCSQSTSADAGHELVGNQAGLIGLNTLDDAISASGTMGWQSNTSPGIASIADNTDIAFCAVFRPTTTTGTNYVARFASSGTEYQNTWYSNPAFSCQLREGSSGNNQATADPDLTNINEWHLGCWRLDGICEVQSSSKPCIDICVDGQCASTSEQANDMAVWGAVSATGLVIGADGAGSNQFDGDLVRVWYGSGSMVSTAFGTTRAQFYQRNMDICQALGICTSAPGLLIIGAGQSNMVGYGTTPTTLTQTHGHFEGLGSTSNLNLLVEGTAASGSTESMFSTLCNSLTTTYGRGERCLVVDRSQSGTAISTWAPGQSNYNTLINTWVTNATAYGYGKFPSFRAFVFWDQGESDLPDKSSWATELAAIQGGMDTAVKAMSGVEQLEVVMFMDQTSNWTAYNHATADLVTTRQYAAGVTDYDGLIYTCEPKYHLATQGDGIHLTTDSQIAKGRYNARCLDTYLRTGSWQPVHVTAASVSSNVVTVTVHTPTPPLVGSCTGTDVTDPGNNGWEWTDTGSSRTISSVSYGTCTGTSCPVTITLSGAPSGTKTLGYAATGTSGNSGGPTTGPRGCVHDSEATDPNWLLHTKVTVPYP